MRQACPFRSFFFLRRFLLQEAQPPEMKRKGIDTLREPSLPAVLRREPFGGRQVYFERYSDVTRCCTWNAVSCRPDKEPVPHNDASWQGVAENICALRHDWR